MTDMLWIIDAFQSHLHYRVNTPVVAGAAAAAVAAEVLQLCSCV